METEILGQVADGRLRLQTPTSDVHANAAGNADCCSWLQSCPCPPAGCGCAS